MLEGASDIRPTFMFWTRIQSLGGTFSIVVNCYRNWEGILIEPNNTNFNKIISKKRRTYVLNACITDKVTVAKFMAFGDSALSGLDSLMSDYHRKRGKTGQLTFVPCFSLVTILKAINVNKVDYFSLDVEGGESFVLKAIDFSKVDIKSLTIEHNNEKEHLDSIVKITIFLDTPWSKIEGQKTELWNPIKGSYYPPNDKNFVC